MISPEASRSLIRKAVTLFSVAIGVPVLLQNAELATLLGRPYAGPVALGFLPLPPQQHHLALLVAGFGLWLVHDEGMAVLSEPSRRTRIVSGILAAFASVIALLITHPTPAQFIALKQLSLSGGLAFTALSYACLLLPGIAAYGLCFPWKSAQRCAVPLAACMLLGIGFIATGVIATVWHLPLVRPALDLATWLLSFIDPSAVSVDHANALLGFRGFTVRVGPQCAAVDGVLLFLLLAGALWWQRPRSHAGRAALTMATGALALFFLNGVRIAMIMIIGTVQPGAAVDLFHGLIGTVMLIGMLWLFVRLGLSRGRA